MDEVVKQRVLRVATFSLEVPFVDALAAYVLARFPEASALSRARVLLPSRRGCDAFRDACLRSAGGRALVLPRVQAIGDVDEEALAIEALAAEAVPERLLYLPPAISALKRHVLLTELVAAEVHHAFPGVRANKEQAALLARDLAKLLDDVAREELSFDALSSLVPEELSEHWQQTVRFLEIVHRHWPRILEQEKAMDAIPRRNALLTALAEHWRKHPPDYPIIAAGSTGTQMATARLLSAVAGLPEGIVILPGLDTALPEAAWEAVRETHPQFALKTLLARMKVERKAVEVLQPVAASGRAALLRAALMPASCDGVMEAAEAQGLRRLDADTPQEEMQAIALLLREALETPGKTAAVVTPDRALARRIAAEMARFEVAIDDSAGRPLVQSPPAVFFFLLAEMAAEQAAPVPLLALLKHPFAAVGMSAAECRQAARMLEVAELRGMRSGGGLGEIKRSLDGKKYPEALKLLGNLETGAGKFLSAMRKREANFAELLALHIAAAEALANEAQLWTGEDGRALADALVEIREGAGALGRIEAKTYPGILRALLSPLSVRAAFGQHPRLHILSPMEARLQHFDLMILAGLNQGKWPPEPAASPWMSRPMQEAFGLPLPERAIGQAAHDFCMLAMAGEVVLSRAGKVDGVKTIPARWLLRMDVALRRKTPGWVWPELQHLGWARALATPKGLPPLMPPAPKPPVSARPKRLSVTDVEKWQRDPYAIYAKHVLGLRELDEIDREPKASDFGNLVHNALEIFVQKYPEALPEDVLGALIEAGEKAFAPLAERPAVRAYWWPRYRATARWVAEVERARRGGIRVTAERKGELAVGDFTLTTKIDRIERAADGALAIIDYKTGELPQKNEIEALISPQLALEAAIAIEALKLGEKVEELSYWKLSGEKNIEKQLEAEPMQLMQAALERLKALVAAYDDPAMPYLVTPDPSLKPKFNDYAHLERAEEWDV